jgi:hypothetical protein
MRTPILTLAVIAALAPAARAAVSHEPFDAILKKHVKRGRVDYEGIKRESRAALDGYVKALGKARLAGASRNEKLAFYLNAYNALVIKSVVDRLPVESVMKVPGFFKRHRHTVAGRRVTLDELEHGIIRPTFKDARVHFALVCAARSCPPLRAAAFHAGSVDGVLDRLAKSFVNSWSGVRIQGARVRVSQIFNWFADDFRKSAGSVGRFLARYHEKHAGLLKRTRRFEHLPYDWSLNKQ